MQLFYTKNIKGEQAFLDEVEARHCMQVLRKKPGDRIHLIDGVGGFYEAEILAGPKKKCLLKILNKQEEFEKRPYKLHIAIAPPKNIDRLEWFLEKAAEISVDEITPVLCQRSERRKLRNDRLEKVLLSATKQSIKAYLPKLNEMTDFRKFISKATAESSDQKFIAYCNETTLKHLKDLYLPEGNVTIMIGPEGDFATEEIQMALENGFTGISLGKSRLRTETAGIVACHIVNLFNQ